MPQRRTNEIISQIFHNHIAVAGLDALVKKANHHRRVGLLYHDTALCTSVVKALSKKQGGCHSRGCGNIQ